MPSLRPLIKRLLFRPRTAPFAAPTNPAAAALMPPSRRVYFIHIMKTAGMTLRPFIEQNFPQHLIHDPNMLLKRERERTGVAKRDLPAQDIFNATACLCGHMNHTDVVPGDFAWITVLREPVSRLYSLYRYFQRVDRHQDLHGQPRERAAELKQRANKMPLEEFLAQRDVPPIFLNGMTRALVGAFPVPRHNQLSEHDLLAEARRTLDRALCVGVMERFEGFLHLLCYSTGWVPTEAVQARNVDPAPLRPRADEQRLPDVIENAVRLDRIIYDCGRQVFERQYARMINELLGEQFAADSSPAIDEALLHARLDERAIDVLRSHASNIVPPAEARVNMADAIRGTGWHDREANDLAGVYRWTGPGLRSTLDFAVASASQYRIEVHVVEAMGAEIPAQCTVTVNGVPMQSPIQSNGTGARTESLRGVKWVISGVVPGSAVGSDRVARLAIHTPRTVSHQELDAANPDVRRKGLAISSVILSAL